MKQAGELTLIPSWSAMSLATSRVHPCERSVSRDDLETGVVGKRGEKWVGWRVWFGVVVRKV